MNRIQRVRLALIGLFFLLAATAFGQAVTGRTPWDHFGPERRGRSGSATDHHKLRDRHRHEASVDNTGIILPLRCRPGPIQSGWKRKDSALRVASGIR